MRIFQTSQELESALNESQTLLSFFASVPKCTRSTKNKKEWRLKGALHAPDLEESRKNLMALAKEVKLVPLENTEYATCELVLAAEPSVIQQSLEYFRNRQKQAEEDERKQQEENSEFAVTRKYESEFGRMTPHDSMVTFNALLEMGIRPAPTPRPRNFIGSYRDRTVLTELLVTTQRREGYQENIRPLILNPSDAPEDFTD